MKKLLSGIATLTLVTAPSLCFSAIPFPKYQAWMIPNRIQYANHGWYVTPQIGLNGLERFDLSPEISELRDLEGGITPPPGSVFPDMTVKLDAGYSLGIAYGYRYKRFRIENEWTFRSNSIRQVSDVPTIYDQGPPPTFTQAFSVNDEGRIASISTMINFYYEFFIPDLQVFPFIGFGAGLNIAQFSTNLRKNGSDPFAVGSQGPNISERFNFIAFQALFGVGYVCSDSTEYGILLKYFRSGTGSVTLKDQQIFGVPNQLNGDFNTYDFSVQYNAMSLTFEVRFS